MFVLKFPGDFSETLRGGVHFLEAYECYISFRRAQNSQALWGFSWNAQLRVMEPPENQKPQWVT